MRVVEGLGALPQLAADICVIGGGPIGLCLAFSLCRRGLGVVLLESGLRRPSPAHQALSDATIISERCHAPMSLSVCRALGGTSWLWGGRCVPLDPVDFEARAHVPESGWPISESDISPYYAEAAHLLDCGQGKFTQAGLDLSSDSAIRLDTLERWSNEPNFSRRLQPADAPGLTIVLDATVVDLEFDASGEHVIGAVVASRSTRETFKTAKIFVLACGGLETSRLLLNVQTRWPRLFGGCAGALGRYYMGHPSGTIADIHIAEGSVARLFEYQPEENAMIRRRLTVSRSAQIAERIPNTSFYPDNPRMADPAHRSGILSIAFLLLSVPALGRHLVAEPIRRMQVSGEAHYAAHLRNILLDLPQTARAVCGLLMQRRRRPVFFLRSREGKYPFHFHAEHLPNRDSRVQLANDTDALGMRRLSIELRFSERDAEGIFRAHEVLDAGLRENKLGRLALKADRSKACSDILGQATDGYHQIGLTRMGFHIGDGVVDRDCRAFGMHNLYIAGTSVFRTSGQASPTFTAAALALRLSEHIARAARSA
jgi:choline dehydrogenase-like flavoprotein